MHECDTGAVLKCVKFVVLAHFCKPSKMYLLSSLRAILCVIYITYNGIKYFAFTLSVRSNIATAFVLFLCLSVLNIFQLYISRYISINSA